LGLKFSTGGFLFIRSSQTAGAAYNLPLEISYTIIGVVIIIVGVVMVNSAINRLLSRISSNPETKDQQHSPLSSHAL